MLQDYTVTTSILIRLINHPQDIFSFGRTCHAAHTLATDPALWQELCCTYSSAFGEPSAWHARGFQHLYLRLVHPYRDLLRCKLWHSHLWPCGCLVRIDAEPPRLVARSLVYRTLNGSPYCHEVFYVELPQSVADQPALQHKAATLLPGLLPLRTGQRLEAAYARSRLVKLLPYSAGDAGAPASAAAAAAAAVADLPASPGALAAGFVLADGGARTSAMCMGLHENLYRSSQRVLKPYVRVAQQQGGSSSGSAGSNSAASMCVWQLPLPDVTPQRMSVSNVTDILCGLRVMRDALPQPVFRPFKVQSWLRPASSSSSSSSVLAAVSHAGGTAGAAADAIANCEEDLLHQLPGLFKGAYGPHGIELVQLQLTAVPAAGCSLAADSSLPSAGAAAASFLADSRREALQRRPGVLLGGLTGLAGRPEPGPLPTSSSSSSSEAEDAAEEELDLFRRLADGVVSGVLNALEAFENLDMDNDEFHDASDEGDDGDESDEGDADGGSDAGDMSDEGDGGAWGGDGVGAGAAAGPESDSSADSEAGSGNEEEHHGGMLAASVSPARAAAAAIEQLPAQHLLLVGTKVLGDVNVPAGSVTFAFDVGSRSLQGAGEPLQLPRNFSSRVELAGPGLRQLRAQERYLGRAQIAATGFDRPDTVAAELLVCAPDCFGVLWGAPLNMLSLFSRVEDAAALPAAADVAAGIGG